MSPEQARGKPLDRRTDIWSFGVLLYEMLVGRRLFRGETVSDILAGVLKNEPDWTRLPSRTPAAVRRMLVRCLTRKPVSRLQAIGDARVILEEVLADPSSWVETTPGAQGRRWRALTWAMVPVVLIAFVAGWFLRPTALLQESPRLRSEIRVPFHAERLEVTGPEVRVIERVVQAQTCGNSWTDTLAAQFSVSETGMLAYVAGSVCSALTLPAVWVDRGGQEQPTAAPDDAHSSVRVSPDGRKLLLVVDYSTVWTYDLERKIRRKQTLDHKPFYAVWGPGPDRITYSTAPDLGGKLYTRLLDGSPGSDEPFGDLDGVRTGSWDLAGERFVALTDSALFGSGNENRIVGYTRDGAARDVVRSPFWLGHPKLSPDGELLAYASDESGRSEIYVRPYDSEGRSEQVSSNGGNSPLWSVDGLELFFRRHEDHSVHAADVSLDDGSLSVGPSRLLFSGVRYRGSNTTGSWSVGPDGRFLLLRPPDDEALRQIAADLYPETIQIVQGWFEELEEKAPSP